MNTKTVYQTFDYSLFKPIEGNRTKNHLHINRLKKSISNNYLFTVITVNERFEIIDGQHRFEVIKDLKLPLNYIMCTGYGLNEVHILNQNSKNWNADDYLDGYCLMGNIQYIEYRNFKNKYKFGHNECLTLLGNSSTLGDVVKSFYNGQFKIVNLFEAERIADLITSIKPLYSGYLRRSFILAMYSLLKNKNFIFEEFIAKLKLQPSSLTDCNSISSYKMLIESIYNYRRSNKVSLRF